MNHEKQDQSGVGKGLQFTFFLSLKSVMFRSKLWAHILGFSWIKGMWNWAGSGYSRLKYKQVILGLVSGKDEIDWVVCLNLNRGEDEDSRTEWGRGLYT